MYYDYFTKYNYYFEIMISSSISCDIRDLVEIRTKFLSILFFKFKGNFVKILNNHSEDYVDVDNFGVHKSLPEIEQLHVIT